ncbi:HAD family hydrolase [Chloroflexota bacterium]
MKFDPAIIEAICFDIDGTISDTDDIYVQKLEKLLRPVQVLFKVEDLTKLARRMVMSFESPANFLMGLPDLIGLDDEIYAVMDFLARYGRRKSKEFRVIPGVREMLERIHKKYPLSVVSARDERTTREFLEETDLGKYFQFGAYAQTCRHTKPFPDPILWASERMGVSPASCLMVGDTTVDIQSGRSAGAQTVGVLCGFGEEDELIQKGAHLILETTADLENEII